VAAIPIIIAGASVIVALVFGVIGVTQTKRRIAASEEQARRERQELKLADAQERGALDEKIENMRRDVDNIGKISRDNRDEVNSMKTQLGIIDQKVTSTQEDIGELKTGVNKLISMHLKASGDPH
jgi:peptidoglycan hydrolase CwlO-like protein